MSTPTFYLSRQVIPEKGITPENAVIIEADKKVSRPHALIAYSSEHGMYELTALGKNGLDVNGEFVAAQQSVLLPNKSRLRFVSRMRWCHVNEFWYPTSSALQGETYMYFLLPKDEAAVQRANASSFGDPVASAAHPVVRGGGGKRISVPYKVVLDTIYDKYFEKYGYFTVLDIARYVVSE